MAEPAAANEQAARERLVGETEPYADPNKPWERQAFENDLWFARFQHYLQLGPTRSVSLAATGRRNAYPMATHWPIVAKQNRWRERAEAWDATQSEASEHNAASLGEDA